MLSPNEALSLVLSHCAVQPKELVALDKALGRVVAAPIRADRDQPPADRSMMDGFAVRAADLSSVPCELKLAGEVAAGSAARPRVKPGTCVRILTGGNLPPGADSVAIVETTEEIDSERIRFHERVPSGAHILRKGENARKSQPLLNAGVRLLPQQIAVCASVGADPVEVHKQPRVAIVCTGEELVAASERPGLHEQRDSNGPALRAAVLATGLAQPQAVRLVEDVPGRVRQRLRAALKSAEVVVVVGGVSAGKYDFVPGVLEDLGCHKVFHRVRMKPGKPILLALGPVKQLVFGLPGNPLSALTGFHEFVLPALEKMAGLPLARIPRLTVRLERPLRPKPSGRVRLYPARIRFNGKTAEAIAVPIPSENSADVVAGGQCDGALVLPEDRSYEAGEHLEFHPWGALRFQSWNRE